MITEFTGSERFCIAGPLLSGGRAIGNLVAAGATHLLEELDDLVLHITSQLVSRRFYHQVARAEESLRATQSELIEISRRAGMAEVAVGVLHNIGNALNGVNISVGLMRADCENCGLIVQTGSDAFSRLMASLGAKRFGVAAEGAGSRLRQGATW